jgi:hypothetical protein
VVAGVLLPDMSPLAASSLALLGLIANVLPITPGGLGVGEAAADALFRLVGVAGGAALVTAWRAGMLCISAAGAQECSGDCDTAEGVIGVGARRGGAPYPRRARRSQRDPMTWERFWPLVDRWIPSAKILHPHPNVRFDAMHPR